MTPSPHLESYLPSLVCPACGEAKWKRPKAAEAEDQPFKVVRDRVCTACGLRYRPPAPAWAPYALFVVGAGAFLLPFAILYGKLIGEIQTSVAGGSFLLLWAAAAFLVRLGWQLLTKGDGPYQVARCSQCNQQLRAIAQNECEACGAQWQ